MKAKHLKALEHLPAVIEALEALHDEESRLAVAMAKRGMPMPTNGVVRDETVRLTPEIVAASQARPGALLGIAATQTLPHLAAAKKRRMDELEAFRATGRAGKMDQFRHDEEQGPVGQPVVTERALTTVPDAAKLNTPGAFPLALDGEGGRLVDPFANGGAR